MAMTSDARRLLATRALRGLVDGAVSVALPGWLAARGLNEFRIGAIVTGTLAGSAALTLAVGLVGARWSRRRVLLGASLLMFATGIGFASLDGFWPLFVIAVVGTVNPSAGDVSLFLPTEQAVLAQTTSERTALFARYNLVGAFAGALGALAAVLPGRAIFLSYAIVGVVAGALYAGLSPAIEVAPSEPRAPLQHSRPIVLRLATLFSIDSFGGGLIVQSLLVLWLYRRFGLAEETAAAIFFVAGLCGALSQLGSSWLASRIGLIPTMVYTHLPSNALLVATALMPTAPLAVACLLLRTCISQMDVPARQAYVMAVVPPEERAAAATVTNLPRSLAAALAPLLTGAMLARSSFGWPLVAAGVIKAVYDILLFVQFRSVRPRG